MHIQTKKVTIICIFLISIIFMLLIENYNLKAETYNILVVSDKDDISKEGLTKNLWEDMTTSYSSSSSKVSKNINYKYLEVKKKETFKSTIKGNILKNDLLIIMGNQYNEEAIELMNEYPNSKFLFIESDVSIKSPNGYKINIDWQTIYNIIYNYLNGEISHLRYQKELKENEILNVWFLEDDNKERYYDLKKKLSDLNVKLINVKPENIKQEKALEEYNKSKYMYIINLNFDNQVDLIKQIVKMQKNNVYSYHQQFTNKEPVQYKATNKGENLENETKANDSDSNLKEEKEVVPIEYIPIHYIGTYEGDVLLGEYDRVLEDGSVIEKNILEYNFEIDYKKYLDDIIFDKKDTNEYILDKKSNTLKMDRLK